jgi:outer membrane protein assembly factor BamB
VDVRRATTVLATGLAILAAALVPASVSARPADRVIVQTVTAQRAGGLVVVRVLVRNRGDAGAARRNVRVDALRGGKVVASRRAALAALRPGRALRVRVVLPVPASVPAVRLRACVETRCERGPVVRVAPDARGAAPTATPAATTKPPSAPTGASTSPPAPVAVAAAPPADPPPAADHQPQPQPDPPSGPSLEIDPAQQTIDRGETVRFTASAPDVEWDLDGDGSFDDAEGAQAQQRFVRSGDVAVRARSADGERTATSAITIRYPGGPLPWRDEVTSVQQDASHTGYQPSGDPAPPLARRWSVSFGSTALGAPLIADGRIFVLANNDAPVLMALDPATGGRLWERPLGDGGADAALSYDAGQVVVETEDELLQAFDAASGDSVGVRTDTGANQGPTVASGGRVVTGTSGPVRAFRLPDLATAWTGGDSADGSLLPAVDRADVFIPLSPCTPAMRSFDLTLGERQWSERAPDDGCGWGGGWAAVYDGLVFSSTGGPGIVRQARDGAYVRAFSSYLMPAFAGDRVLLTDADDHVRAEGLRDGRPLWRDTATTARPPLIVGDRVYLVRADGLLVQLDLATGAQQWSEQLPPGAGGWAYLDRWTGSAAAEGVLLTSWQGTLTAYEHAGAPRPIARQPVPRAALELPRAPLLPADAPAARGGFDRSAGSATGLGTGAPTLRWQTPVLGEVGDAIAVAGTVYAVTGVGFEQVRTLRAFDALTGLQRWSRTGPGIGREVVYGGGAVYVRAGRQSLDDLSPSTVTAYDALTGLERWSTTVLEMDPSDNGLVYDAGAVYVAADRHITALDSSDGDTLWDVPSKANGGYPMALRDGLLVRPLPCGAEAHRLSDGAPAWDYATCTGGGGGDVAIAGGRVYGRGAIGSPRLVYDLASGRVEASLRSTAQQAFLGGVGVQVLGDGLQAVDLPSGRRRWQVAHVARDAYQAHYGGVLAPVVTRDQVVFGISRELHGYDLDSGAERWSLTLPRDIPDRDPFGLAPSLNAGDGLLLVPLADRLAVYGPALELPGVDLPLPAG